MKVLTEEQIEIINDFNSFRETTRKKYYEMEKSMQMVEKLVEKPSGKVKKLIEAVRSCRKSLGDLLHVSISINTQNQLAMKEYEEFTLLDSSQKKNKAIKYLLSIISNFSFSTGVVSTFINNNEDFQEIQRENYILELHAQKVIEIILEQ